jgi:FMN reductase (NADPH)
LKQLQEYDEFISSYYEKRTNGARKDRWTEQMANMLERQTRMYMKGFVQKNKMDLQ